MHRILLALLCLIAFTGIVGCDDPPLTCGIYTYDPDLMTCVCPEGTTLLADGTCLWPDARVPSLDGSSSHTDGGPIEPPRDGEMDSQLSVDDAGIETDGCITRPFYRDADNDSFGSATDTVDACVAPEGYVDNSADCDDECTTCNPGAAETCNGVDDNCNDSTDEGTLTTFFADADDDGFGDPTLPVEACSMPDGHASNDDDCDDACTDCRPGGTEICEGTLDEDCSMGVDDGCGCTVGAMRACPGGSDVGECVAGAQTCTSAGEWSACRGATAATTEVCNGRDDDCDAVVDGPTAASSCTAARATRVGCSAGNCVVTECAMGYGNCDSSFANGCEARFETLAHCGSCGDSCGWDCEDSTCNDAIAVVTGGNHTCAVREGGDIVCWGRNNYGQLGDGTLETRASPALVSGLSTTVVSASAGYSHTCVVLSTGSVRCWGINNIGQLGNGTTTNSASPVSVSGVSGVSRVVAGSGHSCALLTSGGVRCWGYNGFGQLGNATRTDSTTAVAVSGLSSVVGLAAGANHTCAVLGSGAVRCWGSNEKGQLGISTDTAFSTTPVGVADLDSGVLAIALGSQHSCALTTAGAVLCWGAELGDAFSPYPRVSTTPLAIPTLSSGVSMITSGGGHVCALLSAGTARCWGFNDGGSIGDGTLASRMSPVAVSGLSGAIALAAGGIHSCALLSTGALRCWGENEYGVVGDGTLVNRLAPVAVSAP